MAERVRKHDTINWGPWRRGAWPFVRDIGPYQLRMKRNARSDVVRVSLVEFSRNSTPATQHARAELYGETSEAGAKRAATEWAEKWFAERASAQGEVRA